MIMYRCEVESNLPVRVGRELTCVISRFIEQFYSVMCLVELRIAPSMTSSGHGSVVNDMSHPLPPW